MKFKSISLRVAAAASLIAGATLAGAPAHAAGLTGQLDFVWNADATPTSLEFYTFATTADDARGNIGDFIVTNATGSFSSLAPVGLPPTLTPGVVKDLSTIPLLGGTPISQWLDFTNNLFNFKLISFTNTSDLQYKFEGIFTDGTIGNGELTTQIGGSGVKSYSTTIIATGQQIPTPALLPGLIAMGVGVLRKRKAEVAAVEADA